MKIILLLCLLCSFTIPSFVFAGCDQKYQANIEKLEKHLLFAKIKEKKIIKGTFIGTGAVTGVFFGTMFQLITDGATIPISILQGAMFGTFFGGIAAGAVTVPIVTYNQIIKANIRELKKTQKLIIDANEENHQSILLEKMLKKLQRKIPNLTMDALISEIQEADKTESFCQDEEPIFRRRHIRKLIINDIN